MNYLAHFYLADPDPELMFGNFIGDGVRGKNLSIYPDSIARGVRFHRFIDSYTDSHPQVLEAKKLYYPTQAKYSGVVVDVMFDHLLALDWKSHHSEELSSFASKCYGLIKSKSEHLPVRSERFYRYMSRNDILTQYATKTGIRNVLNGMDHRTSFDSNMEHAVDGATEFWEELNARFADFFPHLIQECRQWRETH